MKTANVFGKRESRDVGLGVATPTATLATPIATSGKERAIVNFINILRAAFVPIFLRQKHYKAKL